MRPNTLVTSILQLTLVVACLIISTVPANAQTWSAPVFFSTGSTSTGGQNVWATPNSTSVECSGYYRAGAQMKIYGVMIYSPSPYAPFVPLGEPLVNDVVYSLEADAEATLNFGGEAAPYVYTTDGQVQDYTTSQFGNQFTSTSEGVYLFRNFTLTQDIVHNQWILTGPKIQMYASALANNSYDYVFVDARMVSMTIY